MMKRVLLSIFSILGLAIAADAQSFSLDKDTTKLVVNGYGDVTSKATNNTSQAISLTWKVTSHNFPQSWFDNSVGMCDNVTCYTYTDANNYGVVHQTDPVDPGKTADFKFQLNLSSAPVGGPYYMTLSLTEGSTTKPMTFLITNRFASNVPTVTRSSDITMYPNPAQNQLNVLFDGYSNIKNISVYNLIGKPVKVYNVTGYNANLDVSSIPSGIYFIRLIDSYGRVAATRKFTHQ